MVLPPCFRPSTVDRAQIGAYEHGANLFHLDPTGRSLLQFGRHGRLVGCPHAEVEYHGLAELAVQREGAALLQQVLHLPSSA